MATQSPNETKAITIEVYANKLEEFFASLAYIKLNYMKSSADAEILKATKKLADSIHCNDIIRDKPELYIQQAQIVFSALFRYLEKSEKDSRIKIDNLYKQNELLFKQNETLTNKNEEYIKLTRKKFENHFADWKNHLKAGFVITCIGDDGKFTYKRSRIGNSLPDKAVETILNQTESEVYVGILRNGLGDETIACIANDTHEVREELGIDFEDKEANQ